MRTDLSESFPGDLDLELTFPNQPTSPQLTAMYSNHVHSPEIGNTPTNKEEEEWSDTNNNRSNIQAYADGENGYFPYRFQILRTLLMTVIRTFPIKPV